MEQKYSTLSWTNQYKMDQLLFLQGYCLQQIQTKLMDHKVSNKLYSHLLLIEEFYYQLKMFFYCKRVNITQLETLNKMQ